MTATETPPVLDGYQGYTEWKRWQGSFATSRGEARNFAAEFRGIPLAGKRVLEIGFGEGHFMAWARAGGATVEGIEINPEMLAAASAQGYVARNARLDELASAGAAYDVIVAFDVLEHWNQDELVANFRAIATLLRPDGHFLARFPNGHSPFGRVYQYGDFSHRSVLSCFKIDYLAMLSGLEVTRMADAVRLPSRPDPLRALRYYWRAWRRRRIERMIAHLYGTARLPLAPNLVVVLRKPAPGQQPARLRC
ncbi:MAG TPA: class I SAM-dependent methyltransferase [Rhodanobacteraceae bacterium]|nr:class I SAM-dependent methyltransferase [Rhodanobacteraceae bacterium]